MNNAKDRPAHIGPFYSARTLKDIHRHVKDLRDGLAVYVSREHAFATIGTRGIRPFDGTPGLLVHVSVNVRDETPEEKARNVRLIQPCHNLQHTPASADELKALLIGTLAECGVVPAGSRPDDARWAFF